jgi:PTS system fructose-specific IIA component
MSDATPAALTTEDIVIVGLVAETKEDATRQLAVKLANDGRVTDLDGFLADVRAREEQMATGLPGGIGIPHARSAHVTVPSVAVATSS